MDYFLVPSPYFGRLAWTFFAVQIILALVGAYMAFGYRDRVAFRQLVFRNMGIAFLVVGGVGVLVGALRLFNLPVLNMRIWFYVQLLIEIGLGVYIYYYLRNIYPQQMAQARQGPRRGGSARQLAPQSAAGTPGQPEPRPPTATTGRRDARRDRKRKSR